MRIRREGGQREGDKRGLVRSRFFSLVSFEIFSPFSFPFLPSPSSIFISSQDHSRGRQRETYRGSLLL